MIWKIIGIMAALLTMFGFIPQTIKMARTKSVNDMSIGTLTQMAAGVFLWFIYGIYLKDFIIITANFFIFLTLICSVILYFLYRKR